MTFDVVRINSMMSTVLPTPAPPNMAALPPLTSGASRSMTLMPVWKCPAPPRAARAPEPRYGWACAAMSGGSDTAIRRLADDVEQPAEHRLADRHGDLSDGQGYRA